VEAVRREWEELCKSGFEFQWKAPRPAPDGLLVGGAEGGGPAQIALALRRSGASYVAAYIEHTERFAPTVSEPGVYRIRRTDLSSQCDAQLDELIRLWSRPSDAWAKAGNCIAVERTAPYSQWNTKDGSPAAPYFTRLVADRRLLDGDFSLLVIGQAMIERATGREVVRQMRSAELRWADPVQATPRRSGVWYCGPGAKMGPDIGIIGTRLFAE
jgi:hypothetical protein